MPATSRSARSGRDRSGRGRSGSPSKSTSDPAVGRSAAPGRGGSRRGRAAGQATARPQAVEDGRDRPRSWASSAGTSATAASSAPACSRDERGLASSSVALGAERLRRGCACTCGRRLAELTGRLGEVRHRRSPRAAPPARRPRRPGGTPARRRGGRGPGVAGRRVRPLRRRRSPPCAGPASSRPRRARDWTTTSGFSPGCSDAEHLDDERFRRSPSASTTWRRPRCWTARRAGTARGAPA